MTFILNPNLRTIVISSSRYTSIQRCFFQANLRYNKRIYPLIKAEPLERGSLIDLLANVYYKGRKASLSVTEALNDSLEAGRHFAIKTNLPIEKTELILERFVLYVHHYLNDDWEIVSVQAPFTKIIYQSEENNLQIIAEGLVDLIVNSRASGLLIVDTKSEAREADYRKEQVQKMDNQFKLYCTVFEVGQICINTIGVQKTKNEDALFKRKLINFTKPILEEWLQSVVYWCNSWLEHGEAGLFPRNESSCYGCDYTKICSEQPDMREMIINRDFKIVAEDFDIYKERRNEEVVPVFEEQP